MQGQGCNCGGFCFSSTTVLHHLLRSPRLPRDGKLEAVGTRARVPGQPAWPRAEGLAASVCAPAASLSPLWSAVLIAWPPTLQPKLRSPDTSSLAGGRRASEPSAPASLGLLQPPSVLSSTAAKWSQCPTSRVSSLAGTSACKCRDQKGLLRVGRPLCMTPDPGGRAGAGE